jgi:hypothetical protein
MDCAIRSFHVRDNEDFFSLFLPYIYPDVLRTCICMLRIALTIFVKTITFTSYDMHRLVPARLTLILYRSVHF